MIHKICLNRVVSLKKKKKTLSGWLWSTSRFENHWIPIYLSYEWKLKPREGNDSPSVTKWIYTQSECLWSVTTEKETESRGWPGEMNQREHTTLMIQSPLNPFPPQRAGSWLVLLEWSRKGAQEAAGGHRLGVRRPEFKSWPWKLMVTLGRSSHLPESHRVHPSVNGADNITLPGSLWPQ